MFGVNKNLDLPSSEQALPGRAEAMPVGDAHFVLGTSIYSPFPENMHLATFGLGCFWGAEKQFWQLDGVYSTSVGYAGGFTPNPTYEEVCSGLTGHNEVVQVVFDSERINYSMLLRVFFEAHNPTQGMQQGNDVGTQYRSGIYVHNEDQRAAAQRALTLYQQAIGDRGLGLITTEIIDAPPYYYAEDYHQQYLAKNLQGYCGLGGTGVSCPSLTAQQ